MYTIPHLSLEDVDKLRRRVGLPSRFDDIEKLRIWLLRAAKAYQILSATNYSRTINREWLTSVLQHARGLSRALSASDRPRVYGELGERLGREIPGKKGSEMARGIEAVVLLKDLCRRLERAAEKSLAASFANPLDRTRPRDRAVRWVIVVLAEGFFRVYGRKPSYRLLNIEGTPTGPFSRLLEASFALLKLRAVPSDPTVRECIKVWETHRSSFNWSLLDQEESPP